MNININISLLRLFCPWTVSLGFNCAPGLRGVPEGAACASLRLRGWLRGRFGGAGARQCVGSDSVAGVERHDVNININILILIY